MAQLYSDMGMRQDGGIRRVLSDDDCALFSGCGGRGPETGEQRANGLRVSRHRLVADVMVGVIAKADIGP